jgi:hypothetical protein
MICLEISKMKYRYRISNIWTNIRTIVSLN